MQYDVFFDFDFNEITHLSSFIFDKYYLGQKYIGMGLWSYFAANGSKICDSMVQARIFYLKPFENDN